MAQTEQSVGHTKGPWSVKVAFGHRGFNIMSPPVGGRTFRLFASDHATADDALAAAAAPELLRAAMAALNYIANTESELGITLDSGDELRAAIAKATGASS